ncbi:unnamed protein product [Staurois parvus]|uniref:Uncharacterized protein n=1 Tax=Staurois parvus TaxID=386267 RepID=A0ABN9ASV8_9NEOB|nr:unnamed protein product [Staurois parvus]
MQSGKYCYLGSSQIQTHPWDCQTEKCDLSLQRTHLHCSRVHFVTELLLFPVASTLLYTTYS